MAKINVRRLSTCSRKLSEMLKEQDKTKALLKELLDLKSTKECDFKKFSPDTFLMLASVEAEFYQQNKNRLETTNSFITSVQKLPHVKKRYVSCL